MPFGLPVTSSDRPPMGIELRDGALVTGLVVNDSPDALAWARATYERYRAGASRFGLDEDPES